MCEYVEGVSFPVSNPPEGCTKLVRWVALDSAWAEKIYGTSLEILAKQGGLSCAEIFNNLENFKFAAPVTSLVSIRRTNSIEYIPCN